MADNVPQATWRRVYSAYQDGNPANIMPGDAAALASLAKQWIETKDPSYMDAVISYCRQRSLPILPEMLDYLNDAMVRRIRDGLSGTKAFREAAKARLLEEMAKLVYHGATIDRAAEIAAFVSFRDFRFRFKASTLEKSYSKERKRLEEFADLIFAESRFSTSGEAESVAEKWRAIISAPLAITDEIKGEAR